VAALSTVTAKPICTLAPVATAARLGSVPRFVLAVHEVPRQLAGLQGGGSEIGDKIGGEGHGQFGR